MKIKKRGTHRTYCGLNADQLREIQLTMCGLQEDIIMTNDELDAIDIAIQAVNDIRNAMLKDGKINWEKC